MYTRAQPQFYCIKVGCRGVFITRACYYGEKTSSGNVDLLISLKTVLLWYNVQTSRHSQRIPPFKKTTTTTTVNCITG